MKRYLLWTLAIAGLGLWPLMAKAQPPQRAPRASLGVFVDRAPADADRPGLLVQRVEDNGPAAKAGVQAGDVIVRVGDRDVRDLPGLLGYLADHKPGDEVKLRVLRDGKEHDLTVRLGEPSAAERRRGGGGGGPGVIRGMAYLGVQTQPLTSELADRLGVKADRGVVVTQVLSDSPADRAGLKEDDVITALNGKAISDSDQLRDAVRQAGVGKEVTIEVMRGKDRRELKTTLAEAPAEDVFGLPRGPGGLGGGLGRPGGAVEPDRRVQQLERRIDELERRVRDLERRKDRPEK